MTQPPPDEPTPLPGGEGSADPHLDQVLQILQGELVRRPRPKAFSPEALARLLDSQTEYLTELGLEAIRVAARADNDEVQAVNIDQAERRVRAEQSAVRDLGLAFGGLIGGGAFSLLVAELTIDEPSQALTIVAIALVLLTMGLLVLSILWRRLR